MSCVHRSVTKRPGFTLVETLLALALSSALLVAVFSLVDSTVTYHVTGSDQVLVSQRTLGVLHDLRSDVRYVQADPYWQAIPELNTDFDPKQAAVQTPLISPLQLSDMEKFAEPIRLAGQRDWLMLTLAHANPRWPNDKTNYQQVVWSLGGRGAINVATHDNNGRSVNQLIPGLGQSVLMRTRVFESGGKQSPQSDMVIAADDLYFRFLVGGRWRTSWNSSIEKQLPDAIEVNLQLTGDAQLRSWIIQPVLCGSPEKGMQ